MNPRHPDGHRDRHVFLQRALDELVQDYLQHHPDAIDTIASLTVEQLLVWATQQTAHPTEPVGDHHRDGVLLYAWVDDVAKQPLSLVTVPVSPDALLEHLPLAAGTVVPLEAAPVFGPLARFSATTDRPVRLVRLVEVDTVRVLERNGAS